MRILLPALAAAALALPAAAHASTDHFELWLNPSIDFDAGERTAIELETAQRLRDRDEGGRDTIFARLWVHRSIGDGVTLSGAAEQRWNDELEEQRLHQQLSIKRGLLRSRSRLEQRFVEGDARMGLRYRQRLGVEIPLDASGRWSAGINAEGFFTLRAGDPGGDTGLTGLRTIAEIGYEISDRLSVSAGYIRTQEIRTGRPDRVGHAPLIGIELSL